MATVIRRICRALPWVVIGAWVVGLQAAIPQAGAAEVRPGAATGTTDRAAGVAVYDTGHADAPGGRDSVVLRDRSKWICVPDDAIETYAFQGDCILENERVWLRLPAQDHGTVGLWGRTGTEPPRGVTIDLYDEEGQPAKGSPSVKVRQAGPEEVVVEHRRKTPSGKTVVLAYRLTADGNWIEVRPVEHAGRLGMGVRAQWLIVPSQFGEDYVCDSTKHPSPARVALPRDNAVIVLNCNGDFTSMLTFPSTDQAEEALLDSAEEVSHHGQRVAPTIRELRAKFQGQPVFVALLPRENNWYCEPIHKMYSASGQYASDFKPPYPGTWRLIGRVRGRYRIDDVAGDQFTFGCSWGGTLEYLFAYLYARGPQTPGDVVTPMDVYRQTLGPGAQAYLLETERRAEGLQPTRRTKHRDVCGTVNDLEETWREHLDRVQRDPQYIAALTDDAKVIMERMDARLDGYRQMTGALARVCAGLNPDAETPEYRDLAAAVGNACEQLRAVKTIRPGEGFQIADQIARISREQPDRLRTDGDQLDKLAEQVRAAAQFREDRLKEYRAIAAATAQLCQAKWESDQPRLKELAGAVGRLCRTVLRNRDPEE